uniref:Uncharacterized protein n=1 Tax=Fagus sylvatica TaxID=28930 RepID=A0A2N9I6A8_FAGSY
MLSLLFGFSVEARNGLGLAGWKRGGGFALLRSAWGGGFALPRSAWGGGFVLGLGLCRGLPTRGLVHGAMGGGHMWRRRRDLGLFIEIWLIHGGGRGGFWLLWVDSRWWWWWRRWVGRIWIIAVGY